MLNFPMAISPEPDVSFTLKPGGVDACPGRWNYDRPDTWRGQVLDRGFQAAVHQRAVLVRLDAAFKKTLT